MYELKMIAFLFVRAVIKTEKFCLASNVDGLGTFDDLVFRYWLKEPDVWKTCFIQLYHKEDGGTIPLSDLISMSRKFSLLKYFESYCQIKSKASTHPFLLKHCGSFDEFEFIIYTNGKVGNNSALQEDDSDPLSILSSGTDCGKYITFDEAVDTKIFTFFKELLEYRDFLVDLNKLFAGGTGLDQIDQNIEKFRGSVTNNAIKGKLNNLKKSNLSKSCITRLIEELSKCDFDLYEEFLSKVKIFHSQSNEISLEGLIQKELSVACKVLPSVAKSFYTKLEKGIYEWRRKSGIVPCLSKNSPLWQDTVKYLIKERKEITEQELEKIAACGKCFSEQHIQRLCDDIKHNTSLNSSTNSLAFTANEDDFTPPHLDALEGKREILRFLNIRNGIIRNVLYSAGVSDSVEIIKLVLQKGCSLDILR